MSPTFPVRNVLLGVSGGIGAALIPAWCLWLRLTHRLDVRVVLTDGAARFVTADALRAMTGNDVTTDRDRITPRGRPAHVLLSGWAELVVVAPATGNTVAKLAAGIGDNLLTSTLLNCRCPGVVVPSLGAGVAAAPSTRRNLARLRDDGWGVVPTVDGPDVAGGSVTPGAMPDVVSVFGFAAGHLAGP